MKEGFYVWDLYNVYVLQLADYVDRALLEEEGNASDDSGDPFDQFAKNRGANTQGGPGNMSQGGFFAKGGTARFAGRAVSNTPKKGTPKDEMPKNANSRLAHKQVAVCFE